MTLSINGVKKIGDGSDDSPVKTEELKTCPFDLNKNNLNRSI